MEWVVKLGGSLFPEDAINLCKELVGQNVIVICGGGEFANKIREYDQDTNFSDTTAHKTAILCMDIIGMLVADKIDDVVSVYSLEYAKKVLDEGKLPILLPSKLLEYLDPLEHSWKVTSDSISVYISWLLKTKILIVTNVDGIYTFEPSLDGAKLIKSISAKKLLTFSETSVDENLPELLLKYKLDCYVVNGKYPERAISIIEGKSSKYTFIGGN
ncbi:MAG: delta 1-pyrroline-5-carboxylate synthetase [Methanobacterium sp.]|uniref:amino acid kinase family protein n=1 Tax=Methanobacterium sp. TaxID=2164 RepID=UPI003D6620A5|nr:delta 1-pyrroline-5-carboxylate synthetase [Methanobacterium sp.]